MTFGGQLYNSPPDWDAIAPDLLTAADFIGLNDGPIVGAEEAKRIAEVLRGLVRFHAPRAKTLDQTAAGTGSDDVGARRQSDSATRAPVRDELCRILMGGVLADDQSGVIVDRILDRLIELEVPMARGGGRVATPIYRGTLQDVKAGRL